MVGRKAVVVGGIIVVVGAIVVVGGSVVGTGHASDEPVPYKPERFQYAGGATVVVEGIKVVVDGMGEYS